MHKYLIEIRGKAWAADAGKVVASGVFEASDPWDAAYELHQGSDDEFWGYHYFDYVDVTDLR